LEGIFAVLCSSPDTAVDIPKDHENILGETMIQKDHVGLRRCEKGHRFL